MSTNSSISMLTEDGNYIGIYCHWDGYYSNNGMLLYEYYDTYEKVFDLIKQGDMSSLDEKSNLVKGHSFDNNIKGLCVYYHRDRDEDWESVRPNVSKKYNDLLGNLGQEYNYLFVNNEWIVDNKNLEKELIQHCDSVELRKIIKKKITLSRKKKLKFLKDERKHGKYVRSIKDEISK